MGTAARPLDCSGDKNDGEAGSGTTGEGRACKNDDASDKEALSAESQREPRTGRKNDGVGNQITGEYPGCLVIGGGKAAGDVGQSYRGDGGVQDLHEGRQHHGDRNHPRVGRRRRVLLLRRHSYPLVKRYRRVPIKDAEKYLGVSDGLIE